MQIAIEIPEEDYKWIKEHKGVTNYQTTQMLYNRVRKGTPLPKHGRLVDADVLADGFEDNYEFCEVVNATPTVLEVRDADS